MYSFILLGIFLQIIEASSCNCPHGTPHVSCTGWSVVDQMHTEALEKKYQVYNGESPHKGAWWMAPDCAWPTDANGKEVENPCDEGYNWFNLWDATLEPITPNRELFGASENHKWSSVDYSPYQLTKRGQCLRPMTAPCECENGQAKDGLCINAIDYNTPDWPDLLHQCKESGCDEGFEWKPNQTAINLHYKKLLGGMDDTNQFGRCVEIKVPCQCPGGTPADSCTYSNPYKCDLDAKCDEGFDWDIHNLIQEFETGGESFRFGGDLVGFGRYLDDAVPLECMSAEGFKNLLDRAEEELKTLAQAKQILLTPKRRLQTGVSAFEKVISTIDKLIEGKEENIENIKQRAAVCAKSDTSVTKIRRRIEIDPSAGVLKRLRCAPICTAQPGVQPSQQCDLCQWTQKSISTGVCMGFDIDERCYGCQVPSSVPIGKNGEECPAGVCGPGLKCHKRPDDSASAVCVYDATQIVIESTPQKDAIVKPDMLASVKKFTASAFTSIQNFINEKQHEFVKGYLTPQDEEKVVEVVVHEQVDVMI